MAPGFAAVSGQWSVVGGQSAISSQQSAVGGPESAIPAPTIKLATAARREIVVTVVAPPGWSHDGRTKTAAEMRLTSAAKAGSR